MAEETPTNLPAHKNPDMLWKPGQSGNPLGRPKGSRAKFGEAFCKDFLEAWEKYGAAVITDTIEKDPVAFLRVAAGILPKEVDVTMDASEALLKVIDALNERAKDGLAARISRQRERAAQLRN